MNFKAIFKISLFLAIFIFVWIAVSGLEKALAYSNDFSEPNTITINLLNKSGEKDGKTEELERIRKEIQRISKEVALIRIEIELERIRKEITLLENGKSLKKINASFQEITIQPREGEIEKEIEKKLISPLSEVREKSAEEKPFLAKVKNSLYPYLPWWLILILALYPLIKGIRAWQKFKKEIYGSREIIQTRSYNLV